jgi:sialic acid synthase SpsE
MTASPSITIAGRQIGADHSPYVICELSGNHNGSLERCLTMVDAAAATGCDAIKIQTYTADTITLDVDRPEFKIHGGLWDGRTLYELYEEAHTPFEWHAAIFERARQRGVTILFQPVRRDGGRVARQPGRTGLQDRFSFEAVDMPLIRRTPPARASR